MTSRRVAACVVTGFLGSGKTTLLRGLLAGDPGRDRIAVVVNELGEIGLDGRVLSGFEFVENVVEMASGCVCCSIDEYRFDLAVDELVRRVDPVLLVLETTGVADPAPTLERLRRCGLGVDAVICVVDARAWKTAWRVSSTARRQMEAADFLVITKGDLVSSRDVARLRDRLGRVQPRALVLEAVLGQPFPGAELLLATTAARRAGPVASGAESAPPAAEKTANDAEEERATAGRGHDHLAEEHIDSFSWRTSLSVDRAAFEEVMAGLPSAVLRAKGLARLQGDPRAWIFHFVCGRFEWSLLPAGAGLAGGVQAVFLGQGIAALRDELASRLASCTRTNAEGDSAPSSGLPKDPAAAG